MEILEQLKTEMTALKVQLEEMSKLQLEIESLQLKNQDLHLEIQKFQLLTQWYEQQLKLNRQKRFGKSSEKNKYDMPGQINFFNEVESEHVQDPFVPEPTIEKVIAKPKKKTKRGEFTKSLPVERLTYDLPESEQNCPQCNQPLHVLRQDTRRELKVIPAQVVVMEHVSQIYTCRYCEQHASQTPVIQAPAPKALVKKSLVSPSMMAYIMNQKYTNAMPLNRQEQEFKRFGVNLSRQTLSNWVMKGATILNPLLQELMKELLVQRKCQIKATLTKEKPICRNNGFFILYYFKFTLQTSGI